MRQPPDTEHAVGSPRVAKLRHRREPAYCEVWFGTERFGGYTAGDRAAREGFRQRAVREGFVGFLAGHLWRNAGVPPVPRRKVIVFLREEPPRTHAPFKWCDLPDGVKQAVCGDTYYMLADWTVLE
jgi:hypothetical protein